MAKSFSDKEKDIIKNQLIEKGKELFSQYSLKKTSIEELTKAVGIAQGSFYSFYKSKEELYFQILELEEKKIGTYIINRINAEKLTKNKFKELLLESFQLMYDNPFIRNLLQKSEYSRLIRKLPPERMKKHLQEELQFFIPVITYLQDNEIVKKVKPEVIQGILYSLFLLYLHKNDIGEKVFPEIIDFFAAIISDKLIIKK